MSEKIKTIALTGAPGVGKTTLIRKICQELLASNIAGFNGFYTEEVINGGRRIGFDIVTLSGERDILARESSADGRYRPKIGKYSVYVENFEAIALPVFTQKTDEKNNLIVLDEIGKMELKSKDFEAAVNRVVNNRKLLITVPLLSRQSLPLVDQICSSETTKLFTITKANRNHIKEDIVACVEDLMLK